MYRQTCRCIFIQPDLSIDDWIIDGNYKTERILKGKSAYGPGFSRRYTHKSILLMNIYQSCYEPQFVFYLGLQAF